MRKIILYINTCDSKKTIVAIITGNKKMTKTAENNWSSQALLPLIDKLLKENRLKLTDISEIKIHGGPGSYTGLRVGAAVVNTLSYLLKIPINGSFKPFFPHYK